MSYSLNEKQKIHDFDGLVHVNIHLWNREKVPNRSCSLNWFINVFFLPCTCFLVFYLWLVKLPKIFWFCKKRSEFKWMEQVLMPIFPFSNNFWNSSKIQTFAFVFRRSDWMGKLRNSNLLKSRKSNILHLCYISIYWQKWLEKSTVDWTKVKAFCLTEITTLMVFLNRKSNPNGSPREWFTKNPKWPDWTYKFLPL